MWHAKQMSKTREFWNVERHVLYVCMSLPIMSPVCWLHSDALQHITAVSTRKKKRNKVSCWPGYLRKCIPEKLQGSVYCSLDTFNSYFFKIYIYMKKKQVFYFSAFLEFYLLLTGKNTRQYYLLLFLYPSALLLFTSKFFSSCHLPATGISLCQ